MQAFVSAFTTAKLGNRSDECEDAYAVSPTVSADELIEHGPIVVSVSDGASESLLSGVWARTLAISLTRSILDNADSDLDNKAFADAVGTATAIWDQWLATYILERERTGKPIRWYEQPKLEMGSHAAALTVCFTEAHDGVGRWSACALGDVCLFHVRDNMLLQAFPLSESGQFDSSPMLIGTRVADPDLIRARSSTVSGTYQSGDHFFVGTDAFSAWFLAMTEREVSPWNLLRDITYSSAEEWFDTWAKKVRSSGEMRNDDIAIVHVDMG